MSSRKPLDYREEIIRRRLTLVDKALVVTGGKGGVGKSLVASVAAVLLSKSHETGLLDLDLHGPSCSYILGVEETPIEGPDGLIPPKVDGLKVMSLDLLVKGLPVPLSGGAKEEVVKEVLALTDFGKLDYLVVDLPPGSGDELLAVCRYLRGKGSALVVTTPTSLSIRFAFRVIKLLQSVSFPVLGVVENMSSGTVSELCEAACRELGVKTLGSLPFDPVFATPGRSSLEEILGSDLASKLESILDREIVKL
ncbi:MAG: P-loop NTPase [Candidatus Caldarchaeum sp.]|nr:P-loop NTPase [Candidatus Caldarchaeum sp.]